MIIIAVHIVIVVMYIIITAIIIIIIHHHIIIINMCMVGSCLGLKRIRWIERQQIPLVLSFAMPQQKKQQKRKSSTWSEASSASSLSGAWLKGALSAWSLTGESSAWSLTDYQLNWQMPWSGAALSASPLTDYQWEEDDMIWLTSKCQKYNTNDDNAEKDTWDKLKKSKHG